MRTTIKNIKKDTIVAILVVAGILIAEIGNAYLTYNWKPEPYIKWGNEIYNYNDFYDAVGDVILKLMAFICIRIYITNRILKNIINFYLEALVIDLIYCAFFNPFIYHLDKTQLVGLTGVIYFVQIFFYTGWKRLFAVNPNFNNRKNNR